MHKTEVEEVRDISDEIVAVRVRCCGDPATDSWLTVHGAHKLGAAELDKLVDDHSAKAAERHDGKGKAVAHLKTKIKNAGGDQ